MTPEQRTALDKAHLYIREAETGFLLLEANAAPLQAEAIACLRETFPATATMVLDAGDIADVNPFPQLTERILAAPDVRIVFIQNLQARVSEQAAEQALVRALNLNRDTLAGLQRMLVFILPAYFIDLIYRYAPDFKDYAPILISLPMEQEGLLPTANHELFAPADETFLQNRASFLQDKLASAPARTPSHLQLQLDLAEIHDKLQQYAKAENAYDRAATLARDLNDDESLATCLRGLGRNAYFLGDPTRALEALNKSRLIFEKHGEKHERAVTLGDIARIYVDMGRIDEALKFQEARKNIFEELGNRGELAGTLGDIARVYAARGRVDEALKLHEEELAIFDELGDTHSRAVTLGDIASIYFKTGHIEESLELQKEAFAIYKNLGDKRSIAITQGHLARIYASKGRIDKALTLHEEELTIFDELGDRRSRAVALTDIARIYVDKGRLDEAIKLHEESKCIFEELGDRQSRAVTLGDIARIYADQGRIDEGKELLQQRLAENISLNNKDGIAGASLDLARIHTQLNHFDTARLLAQDAFTLFKETGRVDGIAFAGILYGQLLLQANDQQQAEEVLLQAQEAFLLLGQAAHVSDVDKLIQQAKRPRTSQHTSP